VNLSVRLANDDVLSVVNWFVHTNEIKSILDLGCGDAHYHKYIDVERIMGMDKIPNPYIQHDIESFPYPITETFDMIVLLDVLEHTRSPYTVLSNIKQYIRSQGYVFISVPNIECIDDLLSHINIAVYDPRLITATNGRWGEDHIRFFNISALVNLVQGCGYEIVLLTGANWYASQFGKHLCNHFAGRLNLPVTQIIRLLGEAFPMYSPTLITILKAV